MSFRNFAGSSLVALLLVIAAGRARAQRPDEVRRAQPVIDPPVRRALPVDELTPTPTPRKPTPPPPAATPQPTPRPPAPESSATPRPSVAQPDEPPQSSGENDAPDRRQLDYANGLFAQKQYDLAIPEYEKFVGQFPGAPGRASAFFYLAQCYRALNRSPAARTAFQSVLDEYGESEFAGPAAYGVAEILFTQKDYAGALPLFHRAAAKTKEALGLSARYFEARSLENLDRKDEAANLYLQVVDAKGANQYREDARMAAGSILLARGRKVEALAQFDALGNETTKPALKAEATVRAGMVALDLQQGDKGKPDKAMNDRAMALLQRGRTLPEAGRWRGIAEVGLLRLLAQAGRHAEVIAEYKRGQADVPEEVRPEMMLLAANSHRQLGNAKEAEALYAEISAKYPNREEAKDARYQRLINIYNSNATDLIAEADQFLASNPTGERADQARLLKAEALYKQANFAGAAPIYETLRASQLSPKLRAESAYKLGWCYVQLKDTPRMIEAFSYFLKGFPDNPQVPSILAQRSLAYQETKNIDAAIADLNTLITQYPQAKEREAALQQKALLLGQQENAKGMTEAFQQLLKEYPKTAAAAQAQYYIGKAAFEAKNYAAAIPPLDAARKLNKEQYYTPATVRIVSCYFYQKNRAAATTEVNNFLAADPAAKVPGEILQWLGVEYYNEKNYPAAEKYLSALGASDNLANVQPDFWFYLADAQTKLGKFEASEATFQRYIQSTNDPASKVKALLALGSTKIAAHKADDAQKIAEEIMRLQPEGRVNAEARMLAGDVQSERGRFEDAGKAFMGVALLYDDPTITPRALQKAAAAYEKAGKQVEAAHASEQLRTKYPGFARG
ncbi:MAG: tetratricopeptide repeat protein [Chthoniobacterales bacterium]